MAALGEQALEQVVGDDWITRRHGALEETGTVAADGLAERDGGGVGVELPEARAAEEEHVRRAAERARLVEHPRPVREAHARRRRIERQPDGELRHGHRDRGDGEHASCANGIGTVTRRRHFRTGSR